jgi:hypothetical protein
MFRIFGRHNSAPQRRVITGLLAVTNQVPAHDPAQRIEPVNGALNLSRQQNPPISPLNMGEFVVKDDSYPILWPVSGTCRQKQLRPEHAPRRKNGCRAALEQANPSPQLVLRRDFLREREFFDIGPRAP